MIIDGDEELMPAQLTSGPTPNPGSPMPGPPVLSGAWITGSGNTLTLVFSEPVTGSSGFTITGFATTPSYSSGSGTNTLVFSLLPPVPVGTIVPFLSYTPGNVADTSLEPLAPFSGVAITNNGTTPPVPAGRRFSWKRRSYDANGVRIDHPNGMTGSATWMPAVEPNDRLLVSGTEVFLRRNLSTPDLGTVYEIITTPQPVGDPFDAGFGGGSVVSAPVEFVLDSAMVGEGVWLVLVNVEASMTLTGGSANAAIQHIVTDSTGAGGSAKPASFIVQRITNSGPGTTTASVVGMASFFWKGVVGSWPKIQIGSVSVPPSPLTQADASFFYSACRLK